MIAAASEKQGWDLEPHNRAQIDGAIAHFEGLIHDETGVLKRKLTAEEQRWIQNERKLCALDFRYWLNYASIINWQKKPEHPTLNVAQEMTLDLWSEHEERGIAIILMALKARQLGQSTIWELANCHRFQFWANSNIIIASADPKKTVEMGQMIKFCLDSEPWWLLPSSKHDTQEKNMTVGFAAINTRLSIEAGNKFHGVARGATPNCGHLSEVSSWANAEEDIDASFIRAVHETPDVFIGLESTALGRDNWFADSWDIIKADWPRGRSRIRGMFLPWFIGTDLYPPKADLWRFRQMRNEGWTPNDRTIHHAERARQYVLSNPLLFAHLAKGNKDWEMPIEQMWFYEIERESALKKKTLNKFLSEMPADDNEAFQNTGLSVIDQDVILAYREQVRHPLGVYAVVGPGIHKSLIPPRNQWLTPEEMVERGQPVINVPVSPVTRSTETYQFIPLRFEGYPGYDPNFKLFIYEFPEANETYGIGVDTSDGIGQDWSVIEGFRLGTPFRAHGQTCEFASPYIKADQLWPMVFAVGAFFSVFQHTPNRRTQCRICVECRGNGDMVQFELKKRGWFNFHPWKSYDSKRRIPDGHVAREGVFTNVWFRSMMMDKFLTVIDEESLDIGSPWFVNEMATLERDPDQKSARAAYNTHDDRIMALCFPLFSLTVDLRPRQMFRRSTTPEYLPHQIEETPAESGNYAVWSPSQQASSTLIQGAHELVRTNRGQTQLGELRGRSGGGW